MDAVQIAKANGDLIICLTNHARSPITHHADVVLLAAAKETPLQGGAFSSNWLRFMSWIFYQPQ
nr:SIS domain-containing protein [Paenibacillus larvae]